MKRDKLKIATLNKQLEALTQKTYLLLENTDNQKLEAELKEELNRLQNREKLRVAFVGQYSSGKSTIISALMGNDKIDANVSTSSVNEYEWNGITLVDTPGILAVKNEQYDKDTQAELSKCDLVVYVLTTQLFDDIIFENFIDLAHEQHLGKKMLIAINKMSTETGEFETLEKTCRQNIIDTFKGRDYNFDFNSVFFDAYDYIEGTKKGNVEFINRSNFSSFITALNLFVEENGLIQKRFDTPIRLLKKKISEAVIAQMDDETKNFYFQYSQKIRKRKRQLNWGFEDSIHKYQADVYRKAGIVYDSIRTVEKNKIEQEVEILSNEIEDRTKELIKEVEKKVEVNYEELNEELVQFSRSRTFFLHLKNLEKKLNSPTMSESEKKSLERQINTFDGMRTLDQEVSMFGISVNVIGRPILSIENFKKVIDLIVKITHSLRELLMNIGLFRDGRKEEERREVIKAAKHQFKAEIDTIVDPCIKKLRRSFETSILKNYDAKIAKINKEQISLAKVKIEEEAVKREINRLENDFEHFFHLIAC